MQGSTILGQGLDLRYDSRPRGEYSDRGFYAGAAAGPIEGLDGSPGFLRASVRLRGLIPETSWLGGAARFDWTFVSTPQAPFYDQSTLGGAFLMRGFTEDRFIDQNAWTVELDQRIRILETHIYGVTADWRIDPFVAVGQVYRGMPQAFSHPRVTGGVGFRAFVHPNVLGRVDVATGGEGIKVYVEIGYPY
jgi:hemolysin activation/secretion protein